MPDITVTVKIVNVYEDDEVTTRETVTVPAPRGDLPDWAEEHLYPLTGTGRTEGDAGYFVEITDSSEPSLIGEEFEWGT